MVRDDKNQSCVLESRNSIRVEIFAVIQMSCTACALKSSSAYCCELLSFLIRGVRQLSPVPLSVLRMPKIVIPSMFVIPFLVSLYQC